MNTHWMRPTALAAAALLTLASFASAQDWARKMAEVKEHDFGRVARGSDTVFKFPIKNLYEEDVVLESVRSSCGCTSPSLEKKVLKSWETGHVVAKFNTRTFTGSHSATLTVRISKPYPAQLQFKVRGNIRGEISFEPGSADFGVVDQGSPTERRVTISRAGRSSWEITDVRSTNASLAAELTKREGPYRGRTEYDLNVRLLEDAPAGFLKTQLVLVTNDGANQRIPLEVTADVRPEITVTPGSLVLGEVAPGDTVTKRLLVRGKRPFKITDVISADERFSCKFSDASSDKHIVTLQFRSTGKAGRVRAGITFTTDRGDSFTAKCDAYATVGPEEQTAAKENTSGAATARPEDTLAGAR